MRKRLIIGMLAVAATRRGGRRGGRSSREHRAAYHLGCRARGHGADCIARHLDEQPDVIRLYLAALRKRRIGRRDRPGRDQDDVHPGGRPTWGEPAVLVAAVNADGHDFAPSAATDVVDSKNGSKNTARPAVSGDATVGGELSVSNGSWTPAPASYGYQWQRCDTDGTDCLNVAGANGQTYGVRASTSATSCADRRRADAGRRPRVRDVRLHDVVQTDQPPVQPNKPPTIRFLGLTRVGARMYARSASATTAPGRSRSSSATSRRASPRTRGSSRCGSTPPAARSRELGPREALPHERALRRAAPGDRRHAAHQQAA